MNRVSRKIKVAVGLSGGVDSALAACRMLEAGYEVTGLTMRTRPGNSEPAEAAAALAGRLGIRHVAIDLADDFHRQVVGYYRSEYAAGRTPNPCVRCNSRIKFGALIDQARQAGLEFEFFATGHYARLRRDAVTGGVQLLRGVDTRKDQSYFLARLERQRLAMIRFPLGEWTKGQVIAEARRRGLKRIAERPESQDFDACCPPEALFSPGDGLPGPIETPDGKVLGRHPGIVHYTVGQRRGLGLSGTGEPLYVLSLVPERNALVVGVRPQLMSPGLVAGDMHWLGDEKLSDPMRCEVKIRSRHRAAAATVTRAGDEETAVEVRFDEPQMAVTPGQTVVMYRGDFVLACGTIRRRGGAKRLNCGSSGLP